MSEDAERQQDKDTTVRKIYVLPVDLARRVSRFQTEKGYPSEVEAVRHLLDQALLHYDTEYDLLTRLFDAIHLPTDVMAAVKNIIFGHPLVVDISFQKNIVIFKTVLGEEYRVDIDGDISQMNQTNGLWSLWTPFQ